MPTNTVYLIDTSVLCNLLDVPGKNEARSDVLAEFDRRSQAGAEFLLPLTTLIETGNHICQVKGADRRGPAERLVLAIESAQGDEPPWIIRDVGWDNDLLDALVGGDSSGRSMLDHLSDGTLGTGDIAILVERDLLLQSTGYTDVRVWSLDNSLRAYSA